MKAMAPKLKPIICAVGVCHRDAHLAELWLRWVAFLSAQPGGDVSEFQLLITLTKRADADGAMARFSAALAGQRMHLFGVHAVVLPDEWEHGYPGSASHLFLRTLEIANAKFPGHAVLWCETDAVAMKPGWFREIAQEYSTCGKPFMGARVNPHDQHAHMTGNAVYPSNWRELAPLIATAYNAPGDAYWGREKGQPWDVWAESQVEPQMHECRTIQQIWRPTVFTKDNLNQILPGTCLFHQCKDGSLTLALTETRYPEFRKHLPAVDCAFVLETGGTEVELAGVKFEFKPVARSAGGRLISAFMPSNIFEQLALESAVGKHGVDRITIEDYHKLIAQRHRFYLDRF